MTTDYLTTDYYDYLNAFVDVTFVSLGNRTLAPPIAN